MTTATVHPPPPVVGIVDDDRDTRASLRLLLEAAGYAVDTWPDADACLAALQPEQAGCLLLDVRMPGMGGLQAQSRLPEHGIEIPVIIITGHGDVPMAVAAMKAGAVDFIEKPFNDQLLLDCVQAALARDRQRRAALARRETVHARYTSLTPREREVMREVVRGHANKDIAETLNVSRKTVEVHRAKVMDKMQAESLSQLIQMAMSLGELGEFEESTQP